METKKILNKQRKTELKQKEKKQKNEKKQEKEAEVLEEEVPVKERRDSNVSEGTRSKEITKKEEVVDGPVVVEEDSKENDSKCHAIVKLWYRVLFSVGVQGFAFQ